MPTNDELLKKWAPAIGPRPAAESLVVPAFDGQQAMLAMHDAIMTAQGPSHYIYLLGWFLDDHLPLKKDDRSPLKKTEEETDILHLFTRKARQGVQIRVMLWIQPTKGISELQDIPLNGFWGDLLAHENQQRSHFVIKKWIDALRDQTGRKKCAAIVDWLTASVFGCHHQKLIIVKGTQGLIALVGGVDINPDRVRPLKPNSGQPLHDVHCLVRGAAAWDLRAVFTKRWLSHPSHKAIDDEKGKLLALNDLPLKSSPGNAHVRTVTTFNVVTSELLKTPLPPAERIACQADRTVRELLLGAIGAASQFIYFEDQYMVSIHAANALRAAIRRGIQHITALITHPQIADMPRIWEMRREFIARVWDTREGRARFRVYFLADPVRKGSRMPSVFPEVRQIDPRRFVDEPRFGPHTYVHAKTWVFDDQLAFIGTPNVNNRGWSSDSEVGIGILDNPPNHERSFAQKLRMKLWSMHLGVPENDLTNGIESAKLWDQPSSTSRVFRYPDKGEDAPLQKNVPWSLIDPWVDDLPTCSK